MHFTVAQPFHLPSQIPEQQAARGKRQAATRPLVNTSQQQQQQEYISKQQHAGQMLHVAPTEIHSHTLADTDTHARAKPVSAFVVACFINVCCAKASQVALDAASAVRAARHACVRLPLAAQAIACLVVRTIEEQNTLCLHNLRERKLQHTRNVEPKTRGRARLLQPPNHASVCHLLLRRAHTILVRRYCAI